MTSTEDGAVMLDGHLAETALQRSTLGGSGNEKNSYKRNVDCIIYHIISVLLSHERNRL